MTINEFFKITGRKPIPCGTFDYFDKVSREFIHKLCQQNGIINVQTYSTKFFPQMVILEKIPYIIWDNAYWDLFTNILANVIALCSVGNSTVESSAERIIKLEIYKFLSLYFYDNMEMSLEFANKYRKLATEPCTVNANDLKKTEMSLAFNTLNRYSQIYCFFHEKEHIDYVESPQLYKVADEEYTIVQEALMGIDVIDIGIDEVKDLNKYIEYIRAKLLKNDFGQFREELICDYNAFIAAGTYICSLDKNSDKAVIYTRLMEAISFINVLNHNLNNISVYMRLLLSECSQQEREKTIDDLNEKNVFRFSYSGYSRMLVTSVLKKRTGISHFNPDYYFLPNIENHRNIMADIILKILDEYPNYEIFKKRFTYNVMNSRDFLLMY